MWQNWGRTVQCAPDRTLTARSVEEVVLAVQRARETGGTLRALGAGHSFSGAAMTSGTHLDLGQLRGVVSVNVPAHEVTFWAGTRLWEVCELLQPFGLALENMGDIDQQTLAGAISTGTHGTGIAFSSISTQVTGVSCVTGTGEIVTVNATHHAEWLPGFALSVGALGVLLTVTLRCVPMFALHASEAPVALAEVLETFRENVVHSDHYEFYWFPHTAVARTKRNTRVPMIVDELRPQSVCARWIDEELLNNTVLGGLVAFQSVFPSITPSVNRLVTCISSRREYSDRSERVFTSQRRVRFREMEYALPVEVVPEVMREIDRVIRQHRLTVSFPVEVRVAGGDQLWLSPTLGRTTGYVAVHRYWRDRDRTYFNLTEAIFQAYGGVPHWGKMHSLARADIEVQLPRFQDFLLLRDLMDPDRVFQNSYLERILGA